MRVAVVGGGVAGLYCARHLSADHEVTLLEAGPRVGGHTDTHELELAGRRVAVDTGFIVFNPEHYPRFSAWLDTLGVASRATEMSFGVRCPRRGMEYNATSLNRLFCQRSNLLRPSFLGMVADILRFYRRAPALLDELGDTVTVGQWLENSGLSQAFADDHLLPMASALWSVPFGRVQEFPVRYLLQFMHRHDMLRVIGRPRWRTVIGGSRRYVEAALAGFRGRVLVNSPVTRVYRKSDGVRVRTRDGDLLVDQVVLACHADAALDLLDDPTPMERRILGAFRYQTNRVVLHTDASVMPQRPGAWASWNVTRTTAEDNHCQVTYWMNRLQGLDVPQPLLVSLNQESQLDPDRILAIRDYRHPAYDRDMVAATRRSLEINGVRDTWFCGAAWGWGFHEDAVASAARVITGIRARSGLLAAAGPGDSRAA